MITEKEFFQYAIQNPSPETANAVFGHTVPGPIKGMMPTITQDIESGVDPEIMAEKSLDGIITVVEEEVLGNGVDFVFEKFGDRIVDLMTSGMTSIFERVAMHALGA